MERLYGWYVEMSNDNKEGYTEKKFKNLNENDQIAYGVMNFIYQVNNGGFRQLFDNGYGFLIDFIKDIGREFDILRLQYYVTKAEGYHQRYINGGLREVDYDILLDDLDEGIYNQELLEKLETKISSYLEKQEYK